MELQNRSRVHSAARVVKPTEKVRIDSRRLIVSKVAKLDIGMEFAGRIGHFSTPLATDFESVGRFPCNHKFVHTVPKVLSRKRYSIPVCFMANSAKALQV